MKTKMYLLIIQRGLIMRKLYFLLFFLLALSISGQLQAQTGFADDTVWTIKTDQSAGLFQVKFSDNDSIFWAMGLENGLFFDTQTGREIKRIPGNHEVFFINNDQNFIRTNASRTRIEIFDTKTFKVVDTLENDGTVLTGSYNISKDKKYFIATIPYGYRIWNLQTKSILKTKIYPKEPNLINISTDEVFFICDNNKFIGHLVKTYEDPSNPGNPNYFKIFGSYIVYDFNTLDSIDNYINSRGSRISNHCKYIASATADPNYGVEIYDFDTKELIWKFPINGPSLTGIEFSPDDKYLVTSNDPGGNSLIVWSMETGKETHRYWPRSYDYVNISHDGKFVLSGIGRYIFLFYSRFGTSSVKENPNSQTVVYPNPTNDIVNIQFRLNKSENINIILYDITGKTINNIYNGYKEKGKQIIPYNCSQLPAGTYFIKITTPSFTKIFKFIKK